MVVGVTIEHSEELSEQQNHDRCLSAARALLAPRYRISGLEIGFQEKSWQAVARFDLTSVLSQSDRPIGGPERFRLAWAEHYGGARHPRRLWPLAFAGALLLISSIGQSSGLIERLSVWAKESAAQFGVTELLPSDRVQQLLDEISKRPIGTP